MVQELQQLFRGDRVGKGGGGSKGGRSTGGGGLAEALNGDTPPSERQVGLFAEQTVAEVEGLQRLPFDQRPADVQDLGGPTDRLKAGLEYLNNPASFDRLSPSEKAGVVSVVLSNQSIQSVASPNASLGDRVSAGANAVAESLYNRIPASDRSSEPVVSRLRNTLPGREGRNPSFARMERDASQRSEALQQQRAAQRRAERQARRTQSSGLDGLL